MREMHDYDDLSSTTRISNYMDRPSTLEYGAMYIWADYHVPKVSYRRATECLIVYYTLLYIQCYGFCVYYIVTVPQSSTPGRTSEHTKERA
ncbi:hypothetical protein EJ02DRAFT_49757 [Clathrospora elynae]|uniref:Uncharacterized protein n=1 Tax=Clathrospora elynae TaxID=706981 RepID=A0A6A5SGK9_9PLEO|nr:hypothetical protein EJ02DRAFT_49757 [Clathrospora elynae]